MYFQFALTSLNLVIRYYGIQSQPSCCSHGKQSIDTMQYFHHVQHLPSISGPLLCQDLQGDCRRIKGLTTEKTQSTVEAREESILTVFCS